MAFLTLLMVAQTACKKDKDSSFSCEIDGTKFSAEDLAAYATTFSDGTTTVYGINDLNNSSTNLVYFSLPDNIQPGDYTTNGDNVAIYIDEQNSSFGSSWGQGSGTINVESVSESNIKGTFQFELYNSENATQKRSITKGEFDVLYR